MRHNIISSQNSVHRVNLLDNRWLKDFDLDCHFFMKVIAGAAPYCPVEKHCPVARVYIVWWDKAGSHRLLKLPKFTEPVPDLF